MRYIYCHPLFDERKCAHRFSYQLSCAFENKSLRLERFDYHGTGEADGQFSEVTVQSLRNDLKQKAGNDAVCLIGTRFGAAVVYDYCCTKTSDVKTVVLIEPVVDGTNYAKYLCRKQHLKDVITGNASKLLYEDNSCNLEGYKTSEKFIGQIKQIQLTEMTESVKVGNAVRIIQVSASSKINTKYSLLAECLRKNEIEASVEIFNIPLFWERIPDRDYSILTKRIVEWCK